MAEDAELRRMVESQEIAITEPSERLRSRDRIMQEAIDEADALVFTLKGLHLRMLRTRLTRV